ncbi:MAG: hypothetical protein GC192_23435 [Bacteroidetes bacterium]|nr:hypothetical protein [Bacteroidota bacterium]
MKTQLSLFFFLIVFSASLAQQPLNFDFDKMSVEGPARPWGWSPFQFAAGTSTSLDSIIVRHGKFSLRISNENAADDGSAGDHTIGYWLSPFELSGKNLILTGWVKTEKTAGVAQFSLSAYGDNGLLKETKSVDFRDVSDWREVKLKLDETENAHSYFLILSSNGGGKVWFDDFHLIVDNEIRNSLEVAPDFTPEQRQWLKENCTTLSTFKPSQATEKADFSDLEAFRQSVGDAEIIALGEATHGTSEFFQLKHRLLQFAVQELGVRVFAIEANQLEVEKINRFVCDGIGTAEEVIRVMFKVWNTAEMLSLIEWMRLYNLEHPDAKVEFVGFDLQDPSLPMDSISSFLADWEPDLKPLVDSLQRNYRAAWQAQYYPQADDEVRAGWKANADQVLAMIASKEKGWLRKTNTKAGQNRVAWALQNARVVSQAADIAYSQIVSARDTFMAENIRWIQQMYGPNTRIVVWAHDSHIARSDHPDARYNYHNGDSMGKYLSKIFGNRYRAYGLFTAGGQYSATVSYTNHKVVPVDAMDAPRGSFDEALHQIAKQTGSSQLFLNLKPALSLDGNDWLLRPRPVRFVGYATNDYDFGAMMSVPHQFDGVFFVDKTGASKMLR